MRRMLFALVTGLLALSGSAWADGPMIRWDGIEGILRNSANGKVGDISPTVPPHVAVGGRVMLNLATGFISIRVEGLSFARQFAVQHVLGSPVDEPKKGTVVCASWTQPIAVDTDTFAITNGNGAYHGFIDPAKLSLCVASPEETVFLLRNPADQQGCPNCYFAFGIGRTIQ